ncbi:hypothetical protein A2947_01395 [Candidatus Peribacteria bacterium RIFCSPLOWO2_01_FULL_54_110]|nr:MAG: hypothetical protein A2947_01395 [Candidatus Peribacteria bacterium RIFCSPLOWO2_01_FULL_54_110]
MTYDTDIAIAKQLRLPAVRPSKRLLNAIGILKGRGANARKEIAEIRREWDKREKKQRVLARKRS